MGPTIHSDMTVGRRLGHELREYVAIAAYLYVCFAALLIFKAATLRGHGIGYAPYGLAAGKALLLAKFMLVGHKLRIEAGSVTLMHLIVYKSVLFLLLLVGLSGIEEVILGLIHHRAIGEALAELGGGRLGQIMASSLVLFLILIPYFAYRELDGALGEGRLLQLLRHRAHGREEQRSRASKPSPSGPSGPSGHGDSPPGVSPAPTANP